MGVVPFDTLAFVRRLEAAGIPRPQAEAQADAVAGALTDQVATKADIERLEHQVARLDQKIDFFRTELKADLSELRSELKAEIGEVRTELKAEIGELRTELKTDTSSLKTELRTEMAAFKVDIIKWVFGALIAQTALLTAIRFFSH